MKSSMCLLCILDAVFKDLPAIAALFLTVLDIVIIIFSLVTYCPGIGMCLSSVREFKNDSSMGVMLMLWLHASLTQNKHRLFLSPKTCLL